MSHHSIRTKSGFRNFSSSSAVLPVGGYSVRSVSSHRAPRVSTHCNFGSRSLYAVGPRTSRMSVSGVHPARSSYGYGGLGAGGVSSISINGGYGAGGGYGGGYGAGGGYGGGYGAGGVYGAGIGAGYGIGHGGGPGFGPVCITSVTVNPNLLKPLKLEIDPKAQVVKKEEKEEMKKLNNKFAMLIGKVQHLEQQNKILDTKRKFLLEQKTIKSHLEPVFEKYVACLKHELENLERDRVKLDGELKNMRGVVDDFKGKFEEEINKRTASENEFVMFKKEVDAAYIRKTKEEAKLDGLNNELSFRKTTCDMEISQLQEQISHTSVVVSMDNTRKLDLSSLIDEAKAHYQEMANKSKAEAESWYQTQYEELCVTAGKHGDDLRNTKNEIAEQNRLTNRFKGEIDNTKSQCTKLQGEIADTEERGKLAVKDAKNKLANVEDALQKTKQDMVQLKRDHYNLMNSSMALNMEINAYKALMDQEDGRIGKDGGGDVSISVVSSSTGGVYGAGGGYGGTGGLGLGSEFSSGSGSRMLSGSRFSSGSGLGSGGGYVSGGTYSSPSGYGGGHSSVNIVSKTSTTKKI